MNLIKMHVGNTNNQQITIQTSNKISEKRLNKIQKIATEYLYILAERFSPEKAVNNEAAFLKACEAVDDLRLKGIELIDSLGQVFRSEEIAEKVIIDRFTLLLHKEKIDQATAFWVEKKAAIKDKTCIFPVIAHYLGKIVIGANIEFDPSEAFKNIIKTVQKFISDCDFDINFAHKSSYFLLKSQNSNLLDLAIDLQVKRYDYKFLIEKLLEMGSKLYFFKTSERYCYYIKSFDNDMILTFLKNKVTVEDVFKGDLIFQAILNKNYRAMNLFLENGFGVYSLHKSKYNVMQIIQFEPIYFQSFLKNEFDVKLNTLQNFKFLSHLASWGTYDEITFFLDQGADLLMTNEKGGCPLFNANLNSLKFLFSNEKISKEALEKKFSDEKFYKVWCLLPFCDKDAYISKGYAIKISKEEAQKMLPEAVENGSPNIKVFIDLGADLLQLNEEGVCPIFYAQTEEQIIFLSQFCYEKLLLERIKNNYPEKVFERSFTIFERSFTINAALSFYYEKINSDQPFKYAEWLLSQLRNGKSLEQLHFSYLVNCKSSKEIFTLLAILEREKTIKYFSAHTKIKELYNEKKELSLEETLLMAPFLTHDKLQKKFFSEQHFIHKKINYNGATTSIAEFLEMLDIQAEPTHLEKCWNFILEKISFAFPTSSQNFQDNYLSIALVVQYFAALYFIPTRFMCNVSSKKQITYLTLIEEERQIEFLDHYINKVNHEKYLPWKGEAFQKKMEELRYFTISTTRKKELWELWNKEKMHLDISFKPRMAILNEFKKYVGKTAQNKIDECIDEMKQIESNIREYQTLIAAFVKEFSEVENDLPEKFICYITHECMQEPVKDPYGTYYEKKAITTWLKAGNATAPKCRRPLKLDQLQEDSALKKEIEVWKQKESNKIQGYNQPLHLLRIEAQQNPSAERKKEIQEEYFRLHQAKIALASQKDDPIEFMAESTTLPKGTRLYSCTSQKGMTSILSEGIRCDLNSNFGESEFGGGLYLSTDAPSYHSAQMPLVLILEVIEPLEGSLIEPQRVCLENFFKNSEDEIVEGYNKIKKTYAFLRHAGLPPSETEIVLHDPKSSVALIGVAKGSNVNNYCPIKLFCQGNKIELHKQWAVLEPS